MRSQDARTLARYAIGDASAAEAEAAFLNSLRDPGWMMKWFRLHHDKLTPLVSWTRKPAASIVDAIETIATQYEEVRAQDISRGSSTAAKMFSSGNWSQWQSDLLERVSIRLAETFVAPGLPTIAAAAIDSRCPGVSTCIRTLHSAWWSVIAPTPRRPKPSDFPDALHAAYAPYVDIFRGDAFMAPHVRNQVTRYETTVASTLAEVLPAIESRLRGAG